MVAPHNIQRFLVTLVMTRLSCLTARHKPPMQRSKEENNDRVAMQEEIFLSQLLTAMHVSPETSRLTDNPGMLRGFVSQFREVPHIFKRDGFLGFSVTKLAKRTLRRNKKLIISGLKREYSLQYAFLDVQKPEQEESDKVRLKRSGSGTCGLHTLMVNLTDIGWDFVVSPSTLEYSYCAGQCGVTDIPAKMFVKSHGQIRYKLEQRGALSLPPACCSPSRYSGITMLYMDGLDEAGRQVIRRGEFQETLASQCGCG